MLTMTWYPHHLVSGNCNDSHLKLAMLTLNATVLAFIPCTHPISSDIYYLQLKQSVSEAVMEGVAEQ